MRPLATNKYITFRDNEVLQKYLNEISKIDLITPEEEVCLAIKIHNGDEEALINLVKSQLRFVVSVSKQFQNQGLSLSDLINEGNLGLIKAAKKFDETRGNKFISYAVWWIRQSILMAIAENGRMIRLPKNQINDIWTLKECIRCFEQENEVEPSIRDIEEEMDISRDYAKELISYLEGPKSLDAPFKNKEDESGLYDIIQNNNVANTDKDVMDDSLRNDLLTVMNLLLKPRHKKVIMLYFGLEENQFLPMTLDSIADLMDKTLERIRQIKDESLKIMRENEYSSKILKAYLG